ISPLLSRARVFVLNEHSEKEMEKIIGKAIKKLSAEGGSASSGKIPKSARDWLVQMAQGDARQAITTLETAQALYGKITLDTLKEAIQSKHIRYDKKGEEHFNTISAFIKSMRASQPDAALYYLARMVEAGEDPLFIARRMVVFASEDIGLAVPTALVVANAVFRACETIGYPECAINLAHGVAYLATCKKSRASYDAYFAAVDDVKEHGTLPVPMKVRNAPTKLMKDLKYGKGYEMYDKESYLPEKLKKKKYL
ncbi:MAG: replication-associated recombination protein A, partial [Patescibacteria group bacterium]